MEVLTLNWEAIAAVGEVVGATGVIVSLLYLAHQIRQGRVALKADSSVKAADSLRALTDVVMVSPSQAQRFNRAIRDPDSLSEDDRFWAIQLVHLLLRHFETLHFQYQSGTLDHDLFESYSREFTANWEQPLFQRYWARSRDVFSRRFQKFIDDESSRSPISVAPRRGDQHALSESEQHLGG